MEIDCFIYKVDTHFFMLQRAEAETCLFFFFINLKKIKSIDKQIAIGKMIAIIYMPHNYFGIMPQTLRLK